MPVVLFDLAVKEGDPNGGVTKALDGLKKLEPSPLATKDRIAYIDVANYEQHLDQLKDCDLIIEAVYENMDVKKDIFGKLDTIAKPGAILASNTSYLDIDEIATATNRPGDVLGMHFFSPANVMKLLEVVLDGATSLDLYYSNTALAMQRTATEYLAAPGWGILALIALATLLGWWLYGAPIPLAIMWMLLKSDLWDVRCSMLSMHWNMVRYRTARN